MTFIFYYYYLLFIFVDFASSHSNGYLHKYVQYLDLTLIGSKATNQKQEQ